MEKKRLEKMEFEYEGIDYALDFGIEQVKDLARYSLNKRGEVNHIELVKFALNKENKTGFITDKKAKEITEILTGGVEWGDDFLEFEEIITYIISLFAQAIDTEAKLHEPAVITINEDNTVDLIVSGKEYKLKYNRKDVEEALQANMMGSGSILELYMVGSTLIKTALLHTKKRPSVGVQDDILMAAWATMDNEDTKDDFPNMIQALISHMNDVLDDGGKKSRAVIKMKNR